MSKSTTTVKPTETTLEEYKALVKDFKGVTIFEDFQKFTTNGNGVYNLVVMGYDQRQDITRNLTSLYAHILATLGYKVTVNAQKWYIKAYTSDAQYFANELNKNGFKIRVDRI